MILSSLKIVLPTNPRMMATSILLNHDKEIEYYHPRVSKILLTFAF